MGRGVKKGRGRRVGGSVAFVTWLHFGLPFAPSRRQDGRQDSCWSWVVLPLSSSLCLVPGVVTLHEGPRVHFLLRLASPVALFPIGLSVIPPLGCGGISFFHSLLCGSPTHCFVII